VLVLILAGWQFRWLNELRHEEEARRTVALRVSVTSYAEFLEVQLGALLQAVALAGTLERSTNQPLLGNVYRLDATSIETLDPNGVWQSTSLAQIFRVIPWSLIDVSLQQTSTAAPSIWLDPPAIVYCHPGRRCEISPLDIETLRTAVLLPLSSRVFSDFGTELNSAVLIARGNGVDVPLVPHPDTPELFAVTDYEQPLLAGLNILGPEKTRWLLKVNHGGRSLEETVARSHLNNVVLSVGLLSLLALAMGLVVMNTRRQMSLAREQLYFTAGVSHELRTPLSVIQSAADNLKDGTVTGGDHVRRYGTVISQEVRRLDTMIGNVLQFTHSASAARPHYGATVDMADIIDRTLQRCAPLLEHRDMVVALEPDLPHVPGDATALASAVTNLITNAAHYLAAGNWIRIEAGTGTDAGRSDRLYIRVSNPVDGAPDPHPERLFEPFYRGQRALDAAMPGTGIGLAVTRNVVEQHGGAVTVDTSQRGIITFTLSLPIHDETTHTAR
jgi:signal transduction histidine kinase